MKAREDRKGNQIGEGNWHASYDIKEEIASLPGISVKISESKGSESVYVHYTNNDNGKRATLRFSSHVNNAVEFGDQLDGRIASTDEILFYLGLKKRTFVPKRYLSIAKRAVAMKDISKYEEASLSIQEMYALGKDADLSAFVGKVAKGGRYLILGDKVKELIEKRVIRGFEYEVGEYIYE